MSEEETPITCLIADDHEVVREGLRLALSRTPHIRVVGEAADGEAAVALAERRRPDVVIMDVRMGGMDGFEAACKIRDGASNAAVLFFTAHAERNLLTRGREAGAAGTSSRRRRTQRSSGPSIASRRRRVHRSGSRDVHGRERSRRPPHGPRARDPAAPGRRPLERGRRTRLFISQETVKSHVRHILAKLEADTRTQAVAIALRESIIA